jgi:hypothetical protein
MPHRVVIVIREDPEKSHRAVEALRIALGLSTGDTLPVVVLLGRAPLLLASDPQDIVDGDTLELYLPSLKQLQVPFAVVAGTRERLRLDPEFVIRELGEGEIRALVAEADRTLIF